MITFLSYIEYPAYPYSSHLGYTDACASTDEFADIHINELYRIHTEKLSWCNNHESIIGLGSICDLSRMEFIWRLFFKSKEDKIEYSLRFEL